jgi:FG-GAP-like repeat/FG-GAP repeat
VDHLFFSNESAWQTSFSPRGEIPAVGDFDGDGRDDIVTFVQHEEPPVVLGRGARSGRGGAATGRIGRGVGDVTPFGGPPVYVALSTGSAFGPRTRWHGEFSPKGEIPMVGDFNGDGKDDIISFAQHGVDASGGVVPGIAPVHVALSNGSGFGPSTVWHQNFSPDGEVPMVGDVNGDGKTDIITFARRPQFRSDGTMIGHAPVYVALSTGTSFGPRQLWHTFFSLDGEVPRVADVNLDGKADIITFLHGTGDGARKNNVYVAFSTGTRFETSVTWMTDQAPAGTTPFVGSANGVLSLFNLTQRPRDKRTFIPDLFVFDDATGKLSVAEAMGRIPYDVGAPWERYRFFTPKGLGAAAFPEWIYDQGPNHCLGQPFRFILNGTSGSGGPDAFISSVRQGGGTGHVFEEMSHSIFFNCLRANLDPFHLFASIFTTSMDAGGLDAGNMPGCDSTFDDCRDPEHFFIQLVRRYRIAGDFFRFRITSAATAAERQRRLKQYLWIKQHWYHGAEFKLGVLEDVSVYPEGVLCLPGECSLTGPVVDPGHP